MPAAIILRAAKMIKDSGAAAAIKKYGKEVVDEAKKHIKDIKTKKTVGQAQTEKEEEHS
jgi:geranylgeranyl pyrophosphate synthase